VTPDDRPDLDRVRALMMAALDGEATEEDRAELESQLAQQPALRQEFASLSRAREVTAAMTLRQPPQEVWDSYWTSVYRRAERGVAWVLVSLGAIVLLVWGAWQAIQDLLPPSDRPGPVRVAVLALIAGGAILLVSVIRERLHTWRRDRYSKEVIR
jgi:anti-sigma factor RsiW